MGEAKNGPDRRLIDGLPYFLNYGAPRARAFGARGAPLSRDYIAGSS